MKDNILPGQLQRDNTHKVQVTPYKAAGRSVGAVAAILLALSVLMTACNKPEMHDLAGTWRWTSTTGGIAGVFYTPESEGFEAEIVFKNGMLTFYKDGKKITSGCYQVKYDIDENDTYHVWFSLRIPEAQCKKISKATNGIISPHIFSAAALGHSGTEGETLSLRDKLCDGFCFSFVKK